MGLNLQNSVKLNIHQPVEVSYTTLPDGSGNSNISCNGCNSVTFTNLGTSTGMIDRKIPIIPGSSVVMKGNLGEYLTNIFNITFRGAGTQNILVTKSTYQ